jgi:hypothetical protein
VDDKYITASQAARLFGFSRFYGSKLSKLAQKKGRPFPKKIGRSWMAPISEWEKIFNDPDIQPRKERKSVPKSKASGVSTRTDLITATTAAQILGCSPSWMMILAKRGKERGFEWPKKIGRFWLATKEDWEKIYSSTELKSWSKSR